MNKPKLTIEELIQHCNRQCAKYERLAPYNYDGYSLHSPNYLEHYSIRQYLQELQHYKQLEEQGLLLILPCKVGDEVFSLDDRKTIHPFILKEIVINQYGLYILISYNGNKEYLHFWEIRTPIENIHKTVFLTKAEAEKALEEMEK